jgi:hypothetical protein
MSQRLFTFSSFPPTIQDTNNRILKSVKAMPIKNEAADGDSSFAMGRKYYTETNNTEATLTNKIILKKKYLGGNNHDASSVINRRKNSQIGSGSLNAASGNIAFSQTNDYNSIHRSLARLRGSGKTVPPKVTGRYVAEYETNIANAKSKPAQTNKIIIIGNYSGSAESDVTSLYNKLLEVEDLQLSVYAGKFTIQNNTTLKEVTNYDGADLLLSNFSLVILFTSDQTTNSVQYNASFSQNLNNYINSGGNVIFGNYFFQQPLLKFTYSNIPFLYNTRSNFKLNVLSTLVYQDHSITNGVDTYIALSGQDIDTVPIVNSKASTIAKTANNIPFLSIYKNNITASKTAAFNVNLAPISPVTNSAGQSIHSFDVLIYNTIYWCLNFI